MTRKSRAPDLGMSRPMNPCKWGGRLDKIMNVTRSPYSADLDALYVHRHSSSLSNAKLGIRIINLPKNGLYIHPFN